MTAPLTPPHQPSSDDVPNDQTPGMWPPPYPFAKDTAAGADDGDVATEVRQGAVVLLAVAISGVALGLLWLWLAPRIPLVSDGKAVFLKDTEGEAAVGADGTFMLLALAFGVVSALVVFLVLRRGGIGVVLGLALGGLLGAVLGWGTGTLLGPTHDVVAHARAVGPGVTFDGPLKLQAFGALLAWPIAAMVVHTAVTALFGPRDPEPEWDLSPYGPPPPPPGDNRP